MLNWRNKYSFRNKNIKSRGIGNKYTAGLDYFLSALLRLSLIVGSLDQQGVKECDEMWLRG